MRHCMGLGTIGLLLGLWSASGLVDLGIPVRIAPPVAVLAAWASLSAFAISVAYGVKAIGRTVEPERFLSRRAFWWFLVGPYAVVATVAIEVTRLLSPEDLRNEPADGLLVGSAPFRRDREPLRAAGVTAILNLCLERGNATRLGSEEEVAYAHHPWLDGVAPTLPQLDRSARWVEARRREGRIVLVHCAQGHGRSVTTLAGAMLLLDEAAGPGEALERIQAVRSLARPARDQIEMLERFASGLERS